MARWRETPSRAAIAPTRATVATPHSTTTAFHAHSQPWAPNATNASESHVNSGPYGLRR